MRRRNTRRGRLMLLLACVILLLAVAEPAAESAADRYYLPRVLLWRDADVGDIRRFPARPVGAAPPPFHYSQTEATTGIDPRLQTVTTEVDGRKEERPLLQDVLASTGTTAFVVIQNERLVYEHYFNGHDRNSTETSFSVAKSFVSALVGIAIAEDHISSVDDPVTAYLPELRERDPRFEQITIRHLLTMASGLRYRDDGLPWSADDTKTYYATDLRHLALEDFSIEGEPGQHFEYNNYHPLVLGLVLERATGSSVAQYLEEKLWKPLGMEADGSWSLDSEASGFEKMQSGINERAIDFARFGSLYLNLSGGAWRGQQVVPRSWVEESTRAQVATPSGLGYGYFWWVGKDGRYAARGNHGQFIFVAPGRGLVIVRFGTRFGLGGEGEAWMEMFEDLASKFDVVAPGRVGLGSG